MAAPFALAKIQEQKSYPMQARRRRINGSVILAIRVSSAGLIEQLECMNGTTSLCRGVSNPAEKAQPFPVLHEAESLLGFEYETLYKMN